MPRYGLTDELTQIRKDVADALAGRLKVSSDFNSIDEITYVWKSAQEYNEQLDQPKLWCNSDWCRKQETCCSKLLTDAIIQDAERMGYVIEIKEEGCIRGHKGQKWRKRAAS